MTTNVGAVDRAIRIVIGVGLISLLFLLNGSARWLGLVGFVPLLTAFIRFCPLYAALGLNTRQADKTA